MASGSLLQLVSQGIENTLLESEDADASRPFQQVWKGYSPFASSIEDMQIQLPTETVYGQEIRFTVPRKGDLLRNLYMQAYVTRTSTDPYFPMEELIDSAQIFAGRQMIEEITGDYIRLHSFVYNTNEEDDSVYQYSDFNIQHEPSGSSKTLFLKFPFFFSRHESTALPLISIQNQKVDIIIKFKQNVVALDKYKEPKNIKFLGEYIYLSNPERRRVVENNQMLIENVKYQADTVQLQKSQILKTFEDVVVNIRNPIQYSVYGVKDQILPDIVALNTPPSFIGTQSVFFDSGISCSYIRMSGSIKLPHDGPASIIWARRQDIPGKEGGYEVEFRVVDGMYLEVYIKRNYQVIGFLKHRNVFTSQLLTIRSENYMMDVTQQVLSDEMVIEFDIEHDLEAVDTEASVFYTLHGCSQGQWLASSTSNVQFTRYFRFNEGQSSVDLYNMPSMIGFSTSSTTESTWVTGKIPSSTNPAEKALSIGVKKMYIVPVANNFSGHTTRLFFTGAMRYLMWFSNSGSSDQLGRYTPGPIGTGTIRYDPMLCARIMLNSQPRTGNDFLDDVYFSAVHPSRVIKKSLPAGVHMFSASLTPRSQQPDGFINLSAISDCLLQQRYRRYNTEVDSDLRKLYDNTETLSGAKEINSLHIYGIFFNILYIENGEISLAFV